VEIVAERFAAGPRIGDLVEKDQIAIAAGPAVQEPT
jgi:hypothetical protein